MSILKSILHRWNTTTQSYDTLHPETEHAQVTDFGEGTIAHLISTTLASTVTACATGSVFGKLVEKLLDASGVQYNFSNSNAWYICFGSFFGGLIIQGGTIENNTSTVLNLEFSFDFPQSCVTGLASLSSTVSVAVTNITATGMRITCTTTATGGIPTSIKWVAIGR